MGWRKGLLYSIVTGCMVLGGTAAPLQAADLIDVLKSKNVITEQEADQLKKDQNSGATLPSALKGFKFGTTIFSEWNSRTYDHTSPTVNATPSTNNFNVNRAYLTLTKDVNDWLGANLTADVNYNAGQGWQLRQKYAFAALKLGGTTTELGLVHTPSDDYDGSIWPYRVQGKHLLDDLGIQASADFGIYNKANMKYFGWMAGVYNGAGYSTAEGNGNKLGAVVFYVRPLADVAMLKGLQIAYTGNYGKSNNTFTVAKVPGSVATDFPDYQANIAQISWQHPLFTIMGQYYWGKGTATSDEDYSRKAYLVEGFVRIPGAEKVRLFGRYQNFDPNTDKDNDNAKKIVAGISYDWATEFMPFIAYEKQTSDVAGTRGADYEQAQIGFQMKF